MKSKRDYDLMTIATIGIVISLTCTSLNLLFFSISEKARGAFSTLDFMGRTTMVFLFTLAFVASEISIPRPVFRQPPSALSGPSWPLRRPSNMEPPFILSDDEFH